MIYKYKEYCPKIDKSCFIAAGTRIIGNVQIEENSSIWFNTVLRGDCGPIIIGRNTNIQDNSVIHGDLEKSCRIGCNVTMGHNTVVHACTISDNVLVGMGAIILNGAKISDCALIAAGSVVTANKVVPSYSLFAGIPARFIRKLTDNEINKIKQSAKIYIELIKTYKNINKKNIENVNNIDSN